MGPGRQGQVALGQVGHQDSGMLPFLQWDWPLVSGKKAAGVCLWERTGPSCLHFPFVQREPALLLGWQSDAKRCNVAGKVTVS